MQGRYGLILVAAALLALLTAGIADAKKVPQPVPQAQVGSNPTTGTLAATVVLSSSAWTTGPAISVSAGTWLVTGTVTIAGGSPYCKLSDSNGTDVAESGPDGSISLTGFFTESSPATIFVQCVGSGLIQATVGNLAIGPQTAPASVITGYKTT